MLGFGLSVVFGLAGFGYLAYKLIFWDRFPVGMVPVVIGLFFFASVQLFFIGISGEYIGAIYTKVTKRPLVVEKERINFPFEQQIVGHEESRNPGSGCAATQVTNDQ